MTIVDTVPQPSAAMKCQEGEQVLLGDTDHAPNVIGRKIACSDPSPNRSMGHLQAFSRLLDRVEPQFDR